MDLAGKTGVTVILCPDGAAGAADVRGSATGTRQFDSLVDAGHVAGNVHGLVFAGGSGFGLGCADGVVAHLEEDGAGFTTGYRCVPIVPTAILFDLAFGDATAVPTVAMAADAARAAAAGEQRCGSVGAGIGATVGKANGPACAMKGGFGFAAGQVPGGARVAIAAAVNALGDVRDPLTGEPIAGCRTAPNGVERASARELLLQPPSEHAWVKNSRQGNTTLVAIMTDAALSRAELKKVCVMAFAGLGRCLDPALSEFDGDLVVALSHGEVDAHAHQVGIAAQDLVGEAIVAAVQEADGFGIVPAVADLV